MCRYLAFVLLQLCSSRGARDSSGYQKERKKEKRTWVIYKRRGKARRKIIWSRFIDMSTSAGGHVVVSKSPFSNSLSPPLIECCQQVASGVYQWVCVFFKRKAAKYMALVRHIAYIREKHSTATSTNDWPTRWEREAFSLCEHEHGKLWKFTVR